VSRGTSVAQRVDSRLEKLAATDAHEGPVYFAEERALLFTTVPHERTVAIKRLALDTGEVTTVAARTRLANGMTRDRDGSVLVCEQGTMTEAARIARLDARTGRLDTVVDGFRGRPLNSPNDVVVRSDGTIWFTDPSYGYLQGFRPQPQVGDGVYRFDPATGEIDLVASSFDKPNGLAFSPDERTLYVGDSGANHEPGSYVPERPHHVVAFDVEDGGPLAKERVFAVTVPGFPDGIKVDAAGRVYASAFSGVQVFAPDGEPLGELELPGAVNFTFAEPNVLLITADNAVWRAEIASKGAT
jgi:gluconolactonase